MQIAGIIKDVSRQTRGTNPRGDWTMQWVELVDGRRIKIWTRPDLSSSKNKYITIEDATEDTDREGKPCFALLAGEGSVHVEERQPGTNAPAGNPLVGSKPKSEVRTIDDYEVVLSRAIKTVTKELRSHFSGPPEQVMGSVSQIVTSYMAAYVRGDFAVPAKETTADGEKIPF